MAKRGTRSVVRRRICVADGTVAVAAPDDDDKVYMLDVIEAGDRKLVAQTMPPPVISPRVVVHLAVLVHDIYRY